MQEPIQTETLPVKQIFKIALGLAVLLFILFFILHRVQNSWVSSSETTPETAPVTSPLQEVEFESGARARQLKEEQTKRLDSGALPIDRAIDQVLEKEKQK